MWQLTVKENPSDLHATHSLTWEADSKQELIDEYAEHLFECDRSSINAIEELYHLTYVNGHQIIIPSSTTQKWEFKDKVNAKLTECHEEYLSVRRMMDMENEEYQYSIGV